MYSGCFNMHAKHPVYSYGLSSHFCSIAFCRSLHVADAVSIALYRACNIVLKRLLMCKYRICDACFVERKSLPGIVCEHCVLFLLTLMDYEMVFAI